MFLAHSFRLRDPWQCETLDGGGLRWSRVFHRPTGLEHDDALWLVIAGLPADAAVAVNGQPLQRFDNRNEFDVTTALAETNRIEIEVPSPPPTSPSPPPTARRAVAAATHRPPPTSFPYDVRLGVVGHS